VGLLWEDSVESARSEAGGFAAIGVGGVLWALTTGDGWGYALAAVAAFRVVMATRMWRRLAREQEAARTVGTGRFATAPSGYEAGAVDAFWSRIDAATVQEIDSVEFPEAEPGYDVEQVKAALRVRAAERGPAE
jgi:hypothetical protein